MNEKQRRRPVQAPIHLFEAPVKMGEPPTPPAQPVAESASLPVPGAAAAPEAKALRAWRDDGVAASAGHFAGDVPAPRLLAALNDPEMLPPEEGEPEDFQGIADLLL